MEEEEEKKKIVLKLSNIFPPSPKNQQNEMSKYKIL